MGPDAIESRHGQKLSRVPEDPILLKLTDVDQGPNGVADDKVMKSATEFVDAMKNCFPKVEAFNKSKDIHHVQLLTSADSRAPWQAVKSGLDGAWKGLSKPDLVVILLSSENAQLFSDFKWWSNCTSGVRSVCVAPTVLNKGTTMGEPTLFVNIRCVTCS